MISPKRREFWRPAAAALALLAGCVNPVPPGGAVPAGGAAIVSPASTAANSAQLTATGVPSPASQPATPPAAQNRFVAPAALGFEDAVARAGSELLAQARGQVGGARRTLVVDPLIDANTGAQTVSTASMGAQLESMVKWVNPAWSVRPLTRATLAEQPLLLIGTLTPINVDRAVDTPPDAFRIWLTLVDLSTGRVVAKQLDRARVESVNPEPLKYYRDSPTWHKDKTVLGYINSCQINTKIGDLADPEYLARLPAAAVLNEAIMAYSERKIAEAHALYEEAAPLAYPGDLRLLNGLYLTNWELGRRDAARSAFDRIVESGLQLEKLPLKLLFQPGKTSFNQIGDLQQQYQMWISSLAQETDKARVCVRIVGHTSRTGSARANEVLSRQRAEAVQKLLEKTNRSLSTRLSVAGVGSREALVGLGTDDLRDALDRRVEFRVVGCV